ncbi:MAG TPA: hypothetical protein PLB62_13745, partial [Candidatus Sumerlaeota bacterium]|nr:hypothetical protein [Candidatus Sumerlaeota bacterium]
MNPSSRLRYALILMAALSALFLLLGFTSALLTSFTSDETAHVPGGYMIWKTGDYRINMEHPPLVKLWASFPLLFMNLHAPLDDADWQYGEEWHFGAYFLYFYNDAATIAMASRFQMLLLALILGWAVFLWARELYGPRGTPALFSGLLAAALFFSEPSVIAHSPLVTYDIPFALVVFLTAWVYWKCHVAGFTTRRLLALAVLLALAPLVKIVGLFLWFLLFAHALFSAFMSRHPWRFAGKTGGAFRMMRRRGRFALILALGSVMSIMFFITLWAVYGFRYQISPGLEVVPGPQAAKFLDFTPMDPGPARGALEFIRAKRLMPQGYLAVLGHAFLEKQRGAVLLGHVRYDHGFYHYFLVTMLLKTPFVHLAVFLAAIIALLKRWAGVLRGRFDRHRREVHRAMIPLFFAAGFFMIISLSRVNIGHRMILMVHPFLCILAGPWLAGIIRRFSADRRALAASCVLLLLFFPAFRNWPHYISYFNPLIQNRRLAVTQLADSNIDWGQDMIFLARRMEQKGLRKINLSWFGTADPHYYGIPEWIDVGSWTILIA